MAKQSNQYKHIDRTTITTTERTNTTGGYKIIKTTTTKRNKGILDILIDLFS